MYYEFMIQPNEMTPYNCNTFEQVQNPDYDN